MRALRSRRSQPSLTEGRACATCLTRSSGATFAAEWCSAWRSRSQRSQSWRACRPRRRDRTRVGVCTGSLAGRSRARAATLKHFSALRLRLKNRPRAGTQHRTRDATIVHAQGTRGRMCTIGVHTIARTRDVFMRAHIIDTRYATPPPIGRRDFVRPDARVHRDAQRCGRTLLEL
eukprot:5047722-Prymnesium_polylepis.1